MKALQVVSPGHAEVKDAPVPEPGPGQILLEVLAVTTCSHWDIHVLGGEPMFPGATFDYPYTLGQPGHEACADVVALGDGLHDFAVGDRVCVWRDRGHDVPGCYAQFVVVNDEDVIGVPRELPPESCAPLELAMCVAAHILFAEELDAIAHRRIGVFGLGPAGLVCVQLLRAAGCGEVVGFDPLPSRRELGKKLGADLVFDPADEAVDNIPRRGKPGSFHTSFDCAGSPAAVHRAMELTSHLVTLFAVQREPYVFRPDYWSGLILAGARPHSRQAAERAVAHLIAGELDLGSLVQRTMGFGDYAHAVDLLKNAQALKIALLPQES